MEHEAVREKKIQLDELCTLVIKYDHSGAVVSSFLALSSGKGPIAIPSAQLEIFEYLLEHLNERVDTRELEHALGVFPTTIRQNIRRLRDTLNKVHEDYASEHLPTLTDSKGYIMKGFTPRVIMDTRSRELILTCRRGDPACSYLLPPDNYIRPQAALSQLESHGFSRNQRFMAICGSRGVGKTELSRAFVADCFQNKPEGMPDFACCIVTNYWQGSLSATIAHLPCTEPQNVQKKSTEDQDPLDVRLKLLQELPKPSLLVVDNYSREDYQEELNWAPEGICQKLLETGCYVLLVSHVDLANCRGIPRVEVPSLPLEDLRALFLNSIPSPEVRKAFLEELGEDMSPLDSFLTRSLMGNTFLTILSAGQMEFSPFRELSRSFSNLSTKSLPGCPSIYHNGMEQGRLVSLFANMMNFTGLLADPRRRRLMMLMSLMPTDGMEYLNFWKLALPEEDRQEYESEVFPSLKRSYWCSLRGDRKIRIHPLVRELIARQLSDQDLPGMKHYLDIILGQTNAETFQVGVTYYLGLTISALESISLSRAEKYSTALLSSRLCAVVSQSFHDFRSDADLPAGEIKDKSMWLVQTYLESAACSSLQNIGYNAMSWTFGKLALDDLRRTFADMDQMTPEEKVVLVETMNAVGYSMLQASDPGNLPVVRNFFNLLLTTSEYLLSCFGKQEPQLSERLTVLRQKAISNLGAVCFKAGNYDEALHYHLQSRDERILLAQQNARFRPMLAISYRCVGSDYFMLAFGSPQKAMSVLKGDIPGDDSVQETCGLPVDTPMEKPEASEALSREDMLALLRLSLENHQAGISLLKDMGPRHSHNYYCSLVRMLGTGTKILEHGGDLPDSQLHSMVMYYGQCLEYFSGLEVCFDQEIQSLLKDCSSLSGYLSRASVSPEPIVHGLRTLLLSPHGQKDKRRETVGTILSLFL